MEYFVAVTLIELGRFEIMIFFRYLRNRIKQNRMKYPIGIQSFEKIRLGGYVYVDKTALIDMRHHPGGDSRQL